MLCRAAWLDLQRLSGRVFTIDGACNDSGDNALVKSRYCSVNRPFVKEDLTGHHVWVNPPFQLDTVKSWVEHFLACRERSPSTTSAVFLVPVWEDFPQVFQNQPAFRLLKEFAVGTRLFTQPLPGGQRKPMPGVPWRIQAWHAPVASAASIAAVQQSGSGPFLVEAAVEQRAASVLLDSGAETVPLGAAQRKDDGYIAARWVLRHGLPISPAPVASVKTAGGQDSPILGRVNVRVRMGPLVAPGDGASAARGGHTPGVCVA